MSVKRIDALTFGADVTPGAGDLPNGVTSALLVTVAGTVNITWPDGTNHDGVHLAAGIWHPMAVIKVRSGGTATGIKAGYHR